MTLNVEALNARIKFHHDADLSTRLICKSGRSVFEKKKRKKCLSKNDNSRIAVPFDHDLYPSVTLNADKNNFEGQA